MGGIIDNRSRETEKALDAQRAQLMDDAKKEALDNAEKAPWPNLMNSVSTTA